VCEVAPPFPSPRGACGRSGAPCRRRWGIPRRERLSKEIALSRERVRRRSRWRREQGERLILGGVGARGSRPFDLLKGRPPEPFCCRVPALPACLAISFPAFRTCRPPGRGRRVLLGAAAPRSTPFQPPPATPLALVFARTSLWPGRFSGKIDACHKPLGKRHHDLPSSFART